MRTDLEEMVDAIAAFVAWSKAGRELAHRFARLGLPASPALLAAAGQLLPECPHHGPWHGERTPCCVHDALRLDAAARQGVAT